MYYQVDKKAAPAPLLRAVRALMDDEEFEGVPAPVVDPNVAGGRLQVAAQHLHDGSFAGAVVSQQADDLPGLDVERNVVYGEKEVTVTAKRGALLGEAIAATGVERLLIRAEPNSTGNPYWAFRDPMRSLLGIERRSQEEMAADLGKIAGR